MACDRATPTAHQSNRFFIMEKEFKIRDKRSKGWFYLDDEYLNGYAKIIGPIGSMVYVALCRHAGKEQTCFPSLETISQKLGISYNTAQKYIGILKNHRLIHVEQEKNKNGKFLNNLYYLLDKAEWLPHPNRRGTAHRTPNDEKTVPQQMGNKDTQYINHTSIKSKEDLAGTEINEIINLFKAVNPLIGKYYGNTSQRAATKRMLKEFGKDKLVEMIKVLPEVNKKQYWPKSTTPIQLENNIPIYKAKSDEEKSKVNKKLKSTIIK